MKIPDKIIKNFIKSTLNEDCPSGDATTESIVPNNNFSNFKIIAKEDLICCGANIGIEFFKYKSKKFTFKKVSKDGAKLKKDDILLKAYGPTKHILTCERSVLNIMQRLCGIASLTYEFTQKLKNTNIKILDTRKTTPGLRYFEKYAVKVGGGTNHRFGLSDMILLKENHLMIEALNGEGYIKRAIQKCNNKYPKLKVEVEVRTPFEANEAKNANASIIMLDNMNKKDLLKSIKLIDKKAKIEISGNINLKNIDKYLYQGIDYISSGALTHSVKSKDLSLLIE